MAPRKSEAKVQKAVEAMPPRGSRIFLASAKILAAFGTVLTAKHGSNLPLAGRAALDIGAVLLLVGGAVVAEVDVLAAGTAVGLDAGVFGLVHLFHFGALLAVAVAVIFVAVIFVAIIIFRDRNGENFVPFRGKVGIDESFII